MMDQAKQCGRLIVAIIALLFWFIDRCCCIASSDRSPVSSLARSLARFVAVDWAFLLDTHLLRLLEEDRKNSLGFEATDLVGLIATWGRFLFARYVGFVQSGLLLELFSYKILSHHGTAGGTKSTWRAERLEASGT